MKPPCDMKRRRHAAYKRAWHEAMNLTRNKVEDLARAGLISEIARRELITVIDSPIPEPPGLPGPHTLAAPRFAARPRRH